MSRWLQRLQRARADRAWRRWVRHWRQAVAWTHLEATVLPWRLSRQGTQVFVYLQRQATDLARRGWLAPSPLPGEAIRLPLPQGNWIPDPVWADLLDAWTQARMDRVRPRWFWPLLLGAHDRARVVKLMNQGATPALTHAEVEALRQTRWSPAAFQGGHWAHEAHDRTHRAWVVWLLRRGWTVTADPDDLWAYHWPQLWGRLFPHGVPLEPIEIAMRQTLRENRRLGPADCEQLQPPRGMEGLLRWLARMEQAKVDVLKTVSIHAWVLPAFRWAVRSSEPQAWEQAGALLARFIRLGMRLDDVPGQLPLWQAWPQAHSDAFAQPWQPEEAIEAFWRQMDTPDAPLYPVGQALLARGWPDAAQLPVLVAAFPGTLPQVFQVRQAHIRQAQLATRPPTTPGRHRPRA